MTSEVEQQSLNNVNWIPVGFREPRFGNRCSRCSPQTFHSVCKKWPWCAFVI